MEALGRGQAATLNAPRESRDVRAEQDALWGDPRAPHLPLEVEWIGDFDYDGLRMRRLRYTGSTWQGRPQRVYALYAHPVGNGPFPAVLQIHGGGQTAYPANVAWFVRRGYACLAFDWTGPRDQRPAAEVTQWSEPIAGNMYGREDDNPREVVLYHATLAAIRGLDVLGNQPEVDRNRMGAQGVSWGGLLLWLVNGLDDRLKAAVPVYGIGEVASHWNEMGNELRARSPERRSAWTALFDPESYAARQHAPVLFVNSTNDFWGPLDISERRLAKLAVKRRRSYSPNRMHSLDPGAAEAGMAWLATHLQGDGSFPEEPQLSVSADNDGRLVAIVQTDARNTLALGRIAGVRVDYARGFQTPLLRSWLSVGADRESDVVWKASIPLVETTQPAALVAQVAYEGGAELSSAVCELIPAQQAPKALARQLTSGVLSDWGAPDGGWQLHRGVDFVHAGERIGELRSAEVEGRLALVVDSAESGPTNDAIHILTRVVVDAARNKGNQKQLEIWTHDVDELRVRTNFFLREPGAQEHEATRRPGKGWQAVRFRLEDFRSFDEETGQLARDDVALVHWNGVHALNLVATPSAGGRTAIGQLRWVD